MKTIPCVQVQIEYVSYVHLGNHCMPKIGIDERPMNFGTFIYFL